ncbi:hypothetical protein NL676_037246 [Syzygium grande]|nr:hypothetical protein NL676_037246 [Syzygium grande]
MKPAKHFWLSRPKDKAKQGRPGKLRTAAIKASRGPRVAASGRRETWARRQEWQSGGGAAAGLRDAKKRLDRTLIGASECCWPRMMNGSIWGMVAARWPRGVHEGSAMVFFSPCSRLCPQ